MPRRYLPLAVQRRHLKDDKYSPKWWMEIGTVSDEYLIGLLLNTVANFENENPATHHTLSAQ